MPKIKLRKSELRLQKDLLKKYSHFLPILQLKKQQLQAEMIKIKKSINIIKSNKDVLINDISKWINLFGYNKEFDTLNKVINIKKIITDNYSIAGVDMQIYNNIIFNIVDYDSFYEPIWIDTAIDNVCNLIKLNIMTQILNKQYETVDYELRITTQRVNLFEKVKIPECKENMRIIQIYLSDLEIASISISKIAKKINLSN